MKKMVSLLLVGLLLFSLAACSGDVVSSMPPASLAPTADSMAAPEPEPLNQAFLTGLEKGADYPEGQRICAVMIGNGNPGKAYATCGLSDAKILVEMEANAKVTRFMAIFEDYKTMPTTCQVRSAREQFLQVVLPFRPFFVHDGPAEASEPVNIMLDNPDYNCEEFNLDAQQYGYTLTWRNSSPGPYNECTDGEHIADTIEQYGMSDQRTYNSSIFNFVPYNEQIRTPEGGEAMSVAVTHCPGYVSGFDFDAASGRYMMSQLYGGGMTPTVDANNNQQLGFNNVLVLFAPFSLYPDTGSEALAKIDFTGGPGYYFSNGNYEYVQWEKGSPEAALQIYKGDQSGEQLQVNTGTTYLSFVDDTRFEDFHYSVVGGTAGDVSGGAGGDEVDIG